MKKVERDLKKQHKEWSSFKRGETRQWEKNKEIKIQINIQKS